MKYVTHCLYCVYWVTGFIGHEGATAGKRHGQATKRSLDEHQVIISDKVPAKTKSTYPLDGLVRLLMKKS